MKRLSFFIFFSFLIFFYGCDSKVEKLSAPANPASGKAPKQIYSDTATLKESFNEDDEPGNEYLTEKLKPIRENFKRINSISKWTIVDSVELTGSTEGGQSKFYYQGKKLEKIIARHYGETFQLLKEYYLLSGKLSFVFEKSYTYNRPIYYDSAGKRENNDTEAFNFDDSEIVEERSYFENGKLLHLVSNQDCGAPWAQEFLTEQQNRILKEFNQLLSHKEKANL